MTFPADLDLELQRIPLEPGMAQTDAPSSSNIVNPFQVMEVHEGDLSIHSRLCEIQAELNSFLTNHIDKVVALQRNLSTPAGSSNVRPPSLDIRQASSDIDSHATLRHVIPETQTTTSLVHPSGSRDRSEIQTSYSGSGPESGGVQAAESTANVVALEVVGNPVVPLSAPAGVSKSVARDALASQLHQIHRFLESHTHNIKSLQDFITTSMVEPAEPALSAQGRSALPSSMPNIQNSPSLSIAREVDGKEHYKTLSKQFSGLVLIATFLASTVVSSMSLIQSLAPASKATIYAYGFSSLGIVFSAALLAGMGASMAGYISSKWRRGMVVPDLQFRLAICIALVYIGSYLFLLMLAVYVGSNFVDKSPSSHRSMLAVLVLAILVMGITFMDLYFVVFMDFLFRRHSRVRFSPFRPGFFYHKIQ